MLNAKTIVNNSLRRTKSNLIHLSILLLMVGLLGSAITRAQSNLLNNGSFEDGGTGLGLTSIPGWTVTQGTVDVIPNSPDPVFGGFLQSADGIKSLELIGTPGAAGISQTFPTIAGQKYILKGYKSNHPGIFFAGADIFIDGNLFALIIDFGATTPTNMNWNPFEVVFTAANANTNLTIVDKNFSGYDYGGMVLDGLSVLNLSQKLMNDLITSIEDLVEDGNLKSSHGRALINKLDLAIKQLEKNNTNAVLNKLNDIVVQTQNLIADGEIEAADGQAIIDATQVIIDSISS